MSQQSGKPDDLFGEGDAIFFFFPTDNVEVTEGLIRVMISASIFLGFEFYQLLSKS
jgi:hypothetical protein